MVQLGDFTLAEVKTPHLLVKLTPKDKCIPNSLNTSIHYITTTHLIFFCLRYRVNGQQRRVTCSATLPQNELFEKGCCASCQQSNLSWKNQVVVGYEKLLQKVEISYTFWRFTGSRQSCVAACDNSRVWHDSSVILSNQKSVSCNNLYLLQDRFKHGLKQFARFCCPFHRGFTVKCATH